MAAYDDGRKDDAALLGIANELLDTLHVGRRLKKLSDITSSFFVTLYEGLCAEPVKDVIRDVQTVEDDIHNCQAVIDSLSLDVLNTPLSHITGQDIIAGDRTAIGDLLEVFSGLMEFILEDITSAASTDGVLLSDIDESHETDPDKLNQDVVDSALDQHLYGRSHMNGNGLESSMERLTLDRNRRTATARHDVDTYQSRVSSSSSSSYPTVPFTAASSSTVPLSTAPSSAAPLLTSSSSFPASSASQIPISNIPGSMSGTTLPSHRSAAPASHSAAHTSLSTSRHSATYPSSVPFSASWSTNGSKPLTNSTVAASASQPLLSSTSSSASNQLLAPELRTSSTAFDSVGVRPDARVAGAYSHVTERERRKTKADDRSDVSVFDSDRGQQTYTHHLYHHYDPLQALTGNQYSRKLAPSATALSHRRRDHDAMDSSASIIEPALTSSSSIPSRSRQDPETVSRHISEPYLHPSRSAPVTIGTTREKEAAFSPSKKRSVRFEVSRSPRGSQSFASRSPRNTRSLAALVGPSSPGSTHPQTYRDYLVKYYGSGDGRRLQADGVARTSSTDDEDVSYFSDGCVDYDKNGSVTGKTVFSHELSNSFERELQLHKENLLRKSKNVRFEDHLDNAARGQLGDLRRQFKREDQKARMKKEFLSQAYRNELNDLVDLSKAEISSVSKSAKERDAQYKKVILKKPQTAQFKSDKYSKPVSVLTAQSRSRPDRRQVGRDRKRSASASPDPSSSSRAKRLDSDLFPWLLEEFPYLHLAPATLHNLWRKESLQLEQLSRAEAEVKRKKSKAQEQIEEAERRQQLLVDILHKEHVHRQRLKEARSRQQLQVSTRNRLRDKRLQSARVRKYYEEYQVRQRSRMLKKQTKEELVFKKLFNDGLTIQKERIRDLRNYAKEQREERAKRQQLELEALENYYRDQFALLSESMQREKKDISTREKAQTKVLEQMKRELRSKMEKEIKDFQKRMWEDEDDVYYRELDAERVRHQLSLAQFQAISN